MVSSPQGIFAACIPSSIILLQLPPLPQYTVTQLPTWHKLFTASSKIPPHKSRFDLHPTIPGWFIESALQELPKKLTEIIFRLRLQENLTFQK